MFIIFSLSRPGMCAGALPLHQLLHKLTRSGQHKAVAALRGLSAPLPPDARVRWRIYGTSLSVEVAVSYTHLVQKAGAYCTPPLIIHSIF